MSVPATTRPTVDAHAHPQATPRWHSLDVLKGLALWGMIAHHFQEWTAGEVHGRFVGFERFVVTDLAPPLFAVALGAGAAVVGSRLRSWRAMVRPTWRWAQILLLGIAIDVVVHGTFRGNGVLPSLALLGVAITAGVAAGARRPALWWVVVAACALAAVPATSVDGKAPVVLLVNGPFSVAVYGVYAAAGAALALHALGRSEHALPLLRAAVVILLVGLVASVTVGGALAPDGVWPPARYPGHLSFTLWGLVTSLLIWAGARALLPPSRLLGAAAALAGRRTLLVFTLHFAVRLALRATGRGGELDTWRWGLVTWAAVLVVCAATAIPRPQRRSA